jgi:hypothetical protein
VQLTRPLQPIEISRNLRELSEPRFVPACVLVAFFLD